MGFGNIVTVFLGMVFFILGVILVNVFIEPLQPGAISPILELLTLSLAVFFLGAAFFGRAGFFLLFFAGMILGGRIFDNPIYVFASLMPLLVALLGGRDMGKMALLDLDGKRNFFEEKQAYLAYAGVIILLSVAIGFAYEFLPVFDVASIQGLF